MSSSSRQGLTTPASESTPGAAARHRKEMLGSAHAPAGARARDNEISEPTMETLNGVGRETKQKC